ncbi:MAG: IclR family transcriptional regulator [Clostridiales Family XIII bacterium]|nr:IclR family transcriptional regulator [Clostridiales Family XIII bacterium]
MKTSGNKEKKSIASVVKAIEIIEQIAESEAGLGVTEISQKLNLGVSSTYHILNTLKSCNIVAQDRRTKKYQIGFGLFRIGTMAKGQNLLGNLAKPHLEYLSEELQETANLGMLNGTDMICVAQAEGPHIFRIFTKIGVASPFYFTAGGKLLVSLQAKERWESLIRSIHLEKYTDHTIVNVSDLMRELEATKARGYGVDNEEREEGVICIAAPVYDMYGDAIAALSISGPTLRLKDKVRETAATLMKTADAFSRELGRAAEMTDLHGRAD